ncbi:hypothetical protein [Tritonibacter litoralis]|uniref:hypothetical protein n=1 Tax=Tritonibacter litoralis TaxID=2662264 RepID=UPI0012910B18|nr:hypothetical protein [Tritonibacter litoralis]
MKILVELVSETNVKLGFLEAQGFGALVISVTVAVLLVISGKRLFKLWGTSAKQD